MMRRHIRKIYAKNFARSLEIRWDEGLEEVWRITAWFVAGLMDAGDIQSARLGLCWGACQETACLCWDAAIWNEDDPKRAPSSDAVFTMASVRVFEIWNFYTPVSTRA